jgi:hypothetical protein
MSLRLGDTAPDFTAESSEAKFPNGWKALKPYFRLTPQPK